MEKNENNPIEDFKKVERKKLIILVVKIIIIIYIINSIISFVNDYNLKKIKEQNKIETAEITKSMNLNVNFVSDFEDEQLDINNIEEIEFDNGIKIPTLRKYKKVDFVGFFNTRVESNIMADNSLTITMLYTNDLLVDMFKTELTKQDNYRPLLHNHGSEIKVFVREEENGFFSYIIVNGCEVTSGISYGEPKIKN